MNNITYIYIYIYIYISVVEILQIVFIMAVIVNTPVH